ncbi:MAG: protease Lon-related BREX system protein BrxL [Fusobacterium sp.]|uniref:protease Lon-related BREX system protein BrxL n=1 Tax=Fusobacterium sp. TaxID=68766 RepID=UPI002A753EC8|nr:protease Lon-related BREX system protein BrxL [Fusobacterium sp.]MDY2980260.1 protease Lon-related BREX system protein BrxL [Fusobacterium sp.]
MDIIDEISEKVFEGKIVRKDLVAKIKGGANVPIYVLEYLLGMYCNQTDPESIEEGMEKVKKILSENYVRPDEAEKVKSKIKEIGTYNVIDKVSVKLNEKKDRYEGSLSNLGVSNIEISGAYVKKYEKLLSGGIWCIITLTYQYDEYNQGESPFKLMKLKPIQIASLDMQEVYSGREEYTKDQWISFILRSTGMEPETFNSDAKWHLLTRMAPLVENNYNLCELGPRGTGKSYIYKEISPNSILLSGGQTTVANLFYNMARKQIGLVGYWDVVAFDEIAGIKFKDKDGVQIMKDFMASGSFARGKEEKNANASMVFIGNINQSVEVLVKTSHLLVDFPPEMNNDSAFFDRMHSYIPGWEIPKLSPRCFTKDFGLIVDYMSEIFRELRKISYGDAFDRYFTLGRDLNQRDTIAVRKTVSALVKLIYPNGKFNKDDIEEILIKALEYRRRIKEQLKKMAGMEFFATNFSYIDNESGEEKYISLKEQGGSKLIPEGQLKVGSLYTVSLSTNNIKGVYKIEGQISTGRGRVTVFDNKYKKTFENAFNYLKINSKRVNGAINISEKEFYLSVIDEKNIGVSENLTLGGFIAMCSNALNRQVLAQTVILGDMALSGSILEVQSLADSLQMAREAGAKRALIPLLNAKDMGTLPPDILGEVQLIFYQDPIDAVQKALGFM